MENTSIDLSYVDFKVRNGKCMVMLAVIIGGKNKEKLYNIYKPNSGLQSRPESLADLKEKAKKVTPDEAMKYWEAQYKYSETFCSHMFWLVAVKVSLCLLKLASNIEKTLSGLKWLFIIVCICLAPICLPW